MNAAVTAASAESLRQLLADLHAERVATWRPEDLAVRSRTVRYVDVSPDWLVRTEAEPIIEAVRAIGNDRTLPQRSRAHG